MVTTRIEPFGFNASREAAAKLAGEYKALARKILEGGLFDNSEALRIPWGDERFRRMFAGMAATQAHDAEQFRNVSAFVRALVKGE